MATPEPPDVAHDHLPHRRTTSLTCRWPLGLGSLVPHPSGHISRLPCNSRITPTRNSGCSATTISGVPSSWRGIRSGSRPRRLRSVVVDRRDAGRSFPENTPRIRSMSRRGDGRRERRPYVRPRSRPLETSPSRRRWNPTNARSSSRAQPSCGDRRVADATSPPTFRGVGPGRHQGRYGQDVCRLPRAYARQPPHSDLLHGPDARARRRAAHFQPGQGSVRDRALAASAAWQLTLAGEGPAAPEALRVGPHSEGTVGKRADRSACASSCTWA
jgi:hypothetical protein